jgi:hypothetical protein
MSFWNLNDGQTATQTNGSFEAGGGDIEPIPNKTGCISAIEEAKWDEYQGERYISLKWRVARPAEYANRVIYQKIKVFDPKPEKADKAKRMLAAIDVNAGGKLSKLSAEPTDTDLMSGLMGKMMAIKVMVWEIKEEDKRGNWISAVAPAKGSPQKTAAPTPEPVQSEGIDDDIPF